MRKRFYCFLLSFTVLGMVGCATEPSNSNITPTLTTEVKKNDTTPTSTPIVENEGTPTPTVKNEANNNMNTPTPTKTSSSAFLKKEEKEKQTITKTDGLCEVLEQVDASLQAEYNIFNRKLSGDMELSLSGLSDFCIDETTGVIYFVNKGKDYYLYRLKDGEAKLAVAMPVKQIYTYQGSVYFMIENYDMIMGYDGYELGEFHNGDIYCYTPASGTVELIYEAGAIENSDDHRLTVNEKGIYFSYAVGKEFDIVHQFYHLPFGASEPIEDTEMTTWKGWDNYVFDYFSEASNNLVLQSRTIQEDGTRERLETSNRKIRFCVRGDYLYSAERTYISCLNLKTGEETKYDFLEMWQSAAEHHLESLEDNSGVRVIESFTVTETDIWVTGFGTILGRLNLETGELSYSYICKENKAESSPYYIIQELYTDGKQLYVTCLSHTEEQRAWTWEQPAYFARIQTDTVEKHVFGSDIMMLEVLTE